MNKSMLALLIGVPILVIGIATLLILRSVKATGESSSTSSGAPPAVIVSPVSSPPAHSQIASAPNAQAAASLTGPQASSADTTTPSLVQLRAFGEKIADGWFGASGEKDPFGYVHHHVVRDILKNSTNSLIHPTVWTIVVDEMDEQGRQSTVNFNFYWNGHRLAASESTSKISGSNTSIIVDINELDELAKKIQSQ